MKKEASETLENMYKRLDKFLKTETVIGETMTVGDVKLIPVISASFCLGAGIGGESDQKGSESEGGGGGVGCKISPRAILVIGEDNIELVSLDEKGSLDKLIDKVPELMDKLAAMKGESMEESKEKKDMEEAKSEFEQE